jgi:hypothetical protein
MATVTGELDLSQVAQADFKPDLELRVAAVREGQVLGSTVVQSPSTLKERVKFSLEFQPPGRIPCPVILVVGPNLADQDLLSLDTVRRVVEFPLSTVSDTSDAKQKKDAGPAAAAVAQRVDLGAIVVDAAVYNCWIICCRRHTIRGRVVCRQWTYNPRTRQWFWCDSPVPGATVTIYDVRCIFKWCWRRVIGTATTDVNGNFTFTFLWCCFRWLPWLEPVWTVDPELDRRITQLLASANINLPPTPGPGPDPAFFESILAGASRTSARQLAATQTVESAATISAESLMQVLPRSPELEALHIWPWWPWGDCEPNIVFSARQFCHDRFNLIYSETNAQTRWDVVGNLSVTLLANRLACCVPCFHEPECPDCLKLTWVCNIPTDQISSQVGPPDLRGYADTAAVKDLAFLGDLQIRGAAGVDYFKVQYSFNGGAFTDMPVPIFEGFTRRYFNGVSMVAVLPPGFNPTLKNGQVVMVTRQHYEALNPGIPRFFGSVIWDDYDTLFNFNTATVADGLYQLQLVGYNADAGDNLILASERVLPTCGQESAERLFIRVDNNQELHPPSTPAHPCGLGFVHTCTLEPETFIRKICKNEGRVDAVCVSACDIIHLKRDDTLTIHFTASCPPNSQDGHLAGYTLDAEYGIAGILTLGTGTLGDPCPTLVTTPRGAFEADPTPEIGPDYISALAQGAPRPHWYGGNYKVTLRGCDFPESCAYLFHLCAWKRTTTGCSTAACFNFDFNQFDVSLTIVLE